MKMKINHPKKGQHEIELRLEKGQQDEIEYIALQIEWEGEWHNMIWFQSDGRSILKKNIPQGVPFDLDEDGRLIINRNL